MWGLLLLAAVSYGEENFPDGVPEDAGIILVDINELGYGSVAYMSAGFLSSIGYTEQQAQDGAPLSGRLGDTGSNSSIVYNDDYSFAKLFQADANAYKSDGGEFFAYSSNGEFEPTPTPPAGGGGGGEPSEGVELPDFGFDFVLFVSEVAVQAGYFLTAIARLAAAIVIPFFALKYLVRFMHYRYGHGGRSSDELWAEAYEAEQEAERTNSDKAWERFAKLTMLAETVEAREVRDGKGV